MKKLLVFAACLLMFPGYGHAAENKDVKGGKDHPLLTRMPDFRLSEYKELDFGAHKYAGPDKKPVQIEGHTYFLEYRLNKGAAEPGELKIRRNIQAALQKIGGTVVHDDNFNRTSTIVVKKNDKETWVEVRASNNTYRLNIVEREAMEQVVDADAEAMGDDLRTTGHVSVYGILFDTGKAEIKPESDAAISEIAKLLNANGSLKLYVVGHTDNVGSFDANLKLSKERAEAVAGALATKHGVAPSRLKAFGVGSLSPVASNGGEDGRARNRRVELVEQ